MSELSEFLKEAELSGNEILVKIDDDWFPVIWLSDAYDGSPYGTEAFADENGYAVSTDDITEAKTPSESEVTGLMTDSDRIDDKIKQHEEYLEDKRLDELARKRANRKYNRTQLENRYKLVLEKEPVKGITMKQMRAEIAEKHNSEFRNNIGEIRNIMKGFGF